MGRSFLDTCRKSKLVRGTFLIVLAAAIISLTSIIAFSAISGSFTFKCIPLDGSNTNSTKLNIDVNNTIDNFDESKSYGEISINGQSQVIWAKDWQKGLSDITLDKEGEYTVKFYIFDKDGNTLLNQPTQSFIVDRSAPVIKPIGIEDTSDKQYLSSLNLEISLSDSYLKNTSISIKKDGADLGTKELGKEASWKETFTDGSYIVNVASTDEAGNQSNKTYSFEVDSTIPKITATSGIADTLEKQYFDRDVRAVISIQHNRLKNTYVRVIDKSGKAIVNEDIGGRTSWAWTTIGEGEYTIEVRAVTNTKPVVEASKTYKIVIDKTAPTISEYGIQDGETLQYVKGDQNIGFTAQDNIKNTTVSITKDGAETPEVIDLKAGTEWNSAFDEGNYVMEVSVVDQLNRTITKKYNFIVDKTDPTITASGVEDNADTQYFSGKVTLKLNFSDKYLKDTKITITKDGKLFLDEKNIGSDPYWEWNFDDGEYKIDVITTDQAGREVSKTYNFVVDTIDPGISIEGIKDKEELQYFKEDVLAKISITDKNIKSTLIEITKKGEGEIVKEEIGTRDKWEYKFEVGEYSVNVTSRDKSRRSTTKKFNLVVDKLFPKIKVSGIENKPDEHQYFKDNVTMNLNISDDYLSETVITILNKEGKETLKENIGLTTSWSRELSEGEHKVVVSSKDMSGNNTTGTYIIIVDKKVPSISVIGGISDKPEFQYFQEKVALGLGFSDDYLKNSRVEIFKKGEEAPEVIEVGEETKWHYDFDEGEYALEVLTVDKSGWESKKSYKLVIDKENPVINVLGIDDREDMQYFKENTSVSLSILDSYRMDTTIKIAKKGSSDIESESIGDKDSWTKDFDEGEYKIEITSTDKSGRKTSKAYNLVVDKKAPIIQKPSGIKNHREKVEVGFSITDDYMNTGETSIAVEVLMKDGATKEYKIAPENGEGWSSFNHVFSDEGNYTLRINSTDMSGNKAEEVVSSFIIDRTRPDLTLVGFDDKEENNKSKTDIVVSVKDLNFQLGEARLSITKDGSSYTRVSQPGSRDEWSNFKFALYDEGTYVVSVISRDILGNESSETRTLVIDRTAPIITPKFKGEDRVIKNNEYIKDLFTPDFQLDRPDVDNINSVVLNGGEVKGKIPLSSTEMVYNYRVIASDKAGNTTTLNLVYTVDFTKPEIKITDIVNGYFKNNLAPKVEYSDTYLDESKVSVTLNGEPFVSGTILEKEQDYILKVVAYDLAGNMNSQTVVFTLDKTAPIIKFTEDISGKYFNKDFIPEFIIQDMVEYDIINMTLNGEKYEKGTPITQDGKYVLFIEAKDKSGNISKITIEFILDKTPPKIIYTGAKPNGKYYESINLSIGLDNPGDKIKSIKINGDLFEGEAVEENGQKVIKTVLTEIKDYSVEVTAEDIAGNIITDKLGFKIAEKSLFVKLYENKPLFITTVSAVVLAATAAVYMIFRKRGTGNTKSA